MLLELAVLPVKVLEELPPTIDMPVPFEVALLFVKLLFEPPDRRIPSGLFDSMYGIINDIAIA